MSDFEINSKVLSNILYEQCCGMHNGQMARVPNNPILHSIFSCMTNNGEIPSKEDFSDILISIAYEMKEK